MVVPGRWIPGTVILIESDGHVSDGQHRLHAVIESGATVRFVILTDVPEDVKFYVDCGKRRTGGDLWGIHGVANGSLLSAIAVKVAGWRRTKSIASCYGQRAATFSEQQDLVRSDPGIMEAVEFARTHRELGKLLSQSLVGFLFYVAALADRNAAMFFLEALESGAGLESGNPILTLRNRLQALRADRAKHRAEDVADLVARAWNAWRTGKSWRIAKLRDARGLPDMV